MLPIGDDNWDRRRRPIVTSLLLAANVLVFLYELSLGGGDHQLTEFIQRWGVIPGQLTGDLDVRPHSASPAWVTLFTSLFIHGGWLHLIGNMLYLWIFGDNVEDRVGHLPFLLFYGAAGVLATMAQIAVDPGSELPQVGASGAIAGVLGAYVVLFPLRRVRILLVIIIVEVPALLVLGLWVGTQVVAGVGAIVSTQTDEGGVAYMAHVGGFTAGAAVGTIARLLGQGRSRRSRPRGLTPQPW